MNARTIRRAIERKARKQSQKLQNHDRKGVFSMPNPTPESPSSPVPDSFTAEPTNPISQRQIEANRRNARLSTGPKSSSGKAISSQNNFKHGFCGIFQLIEGENSDDFNALLRGFKQEHQPATPSEAALVKGLAEHYWLSRRAMSLITDLLSNGHPTGESQKLLALYLRYQATHDRGFSKCLNELIKVRAEKRKAQNGFEQQKLKQAAETRKNELHHARVRIANAKAEYTEARKKKLEDTRKPPFVAAQAA